MLTSMIMKLRALPRSFLMIVTMVCLAALASASGSGQINMWLSDFTKLEDSTKVKVRWLKEKLKILTDYKKRYIDPFNEHINKRDFVETTLDLFDDDRFRLQGWMEMYDSKWFDHTRLECFKTILKDVLGYTQTINDFVDLDSDDAAGQHSYLLEKFTEFKEAHTKTEWNEKADRIEIEVAKDSQTDPEVKRMYTQDEMVEIRNKSYADGYISLGKHILSQANKFSLDTQLALSDSDLQVYIRHQLSQIIREWNVSSATHKICRFLTNPKLQSDYSVKEAVDCCVNQLIDDKLLKVERAGAEFDDFFSDAKYIFESPQNPLARHDLTLSGALHEIRQLYTIPSFSWMDMARLVEYVILQQRSKRDGLLTPDQIWQRQTMKNLLYDRFGHLADRFGWFVKDPDYVPLGMGIRYKMPRDHGKCENCKSTKGFRFWNIVNKISGQNCWTCGRLLCDSCAAKRTITIWDAGVKGLGTTERCCKDGVGCRRSCVQIPPEATITVDPRVNEGKDAQYVQLPASEEVRLNEGLEALANSDPAEDDASTPASFPFQVWNTPKERRLLDDSIPDTSFWNGVISSLIVLLGSFFAYHLLFTKVETTSSQRRTLYVKKKRSTFFKGRKSQVRKSSVREVKCKLSTVLRRQLSKLDEK